MRRLFNTLYALMTGSAFIGFSVLFFYSLGTEIELTMVLFPLIFFLFSLILLLRNVANSYYRLTIIGISIYQWIRCVFLPVAGFFVGRYTALMQSSTWLTTAYLMCAEEIIIFLFLLLLAEKTRKPEVTPIESRLTLKGSYILYVAFAIAAILLYLIMGNGEKLFSFIALDVESAREKEATEGNMLSSFVSAAMTFTSLMLIYKCYTLYTKTKKNKYMYYSLLIAGTMLCIIVGERRARQLYLLFAYIWILTRLYPEKRRTIITFLAAVGGAVLGMMSLYKFYHAFLHGSYLDTLTEAEFSFRDTVGRFDSYFYGLSVVDRSTNFVLNYDMPFKQLFIDILRNTFGIHYLFKGNYTTTQLMNMYMYNSEAQTTGYLMSSASYGFMFFGYIGPIISLVGVGAMAILEKAMYKAKTIEWSYTFAFLFMRCLMGLFSCFPMVLNDASRTLVLHFVVIMSASILMRRTQRTSS